MNLPQDPKRTALLNLQGEINENTTLALIYQLEALVHARPQPTEVRVHIQSYGGKTNFGILLYHYFRFYPLPLTAVNVGFVKSSAAIAFLGAPCRMAVEGASFMIHAVQPDPHVFNEATPSEKAFTCSLIRRQEEHIAKIYETHLTLTPTEQKELAEAECEILSPRSSTCGFVNMPYSAI